MRVSWTLPIVLTGTVVSAIDLDVYDEQSLKDAAGTASYNAMTFYKANQTGEIPGKLPKAWWQGALLFDTLIRYGHFADDASNNAAISQGMYHQAGDHSDYMPANWSSYIANDDQAFWGLAAMTAAELDFPADSKQPSWVDLAQNVFDKQVNRWDEDSCKGGMRWQISPYQAGYAMKTAITNGALFQLSARLARYTGNSTYSKWAEKVWDWSKETLMDEKIWEIADGVSVTDHCKGLSHMQWTPNYGLYLGGAAYMYNVTDGKKEWKKSIDGLLNTTFETFFPKQYNGTMTEVICEPIDNCAQNQEIFKAILSSNLASTALVAPYTAEGILPKLQDSATAAAKHCTEGKDKSFCGYRWYKSNGDHKLNMAEQISATGLFSANLVAFKDQTLIYTSKTSGSRTSGNDNSTGASASASASASATGDANGAGTMGVSGWGIAGVAMVVSLAEMIV
ncbi:glycosyl hydrolase family 76 protein [Aspergillus steynii IBT 23096]|uniref:Mannan endo-1,6-alpha-mannosidase n=1 Tax=Aspergillus steynii IBT 23096 TaxID=1392250 RepID=A0A2I2GSI0_9EURO|nr:glycosyl hydrolase family 76 protein [Aspergillus steynii IBT 23096]PLB55833.1 glycosyl hydrolase family 76 protein [Aspergillus steynii IBT 23096]